MSCQSLPTAKAEQTRHTSQGRGLAHADASLTCFITRTINERPEEHVSISSQLPRTTRYIVLGCVGVLALCTGSSVAATPKVLTFVEPEKGSTFAFVDNAPKTKLVHGEPAVISPGDQVVFSRSIQEGAANVGRAEVSCVATRRSKRIDKAGLVCHGIYVLQTGILTSSTIVTSSGAEGAITGGTGVYASARGTLLGTVSPGSSTTVITLTG